jgi:hypothetical protein
METALRVMSPPGLLNLSLFRVNWLPHPADSISAQGKYIFVSSGNGMTLIDMIKSVF